jgi:hypothetical protein
MTKKRGHGNPKKDIFQLAAEALVGKASNGDVQAFKELADRIDGRATYITAETVKECTSPSNVEIFFAQ